MPTTRVVLSVIALFTAAACSAPGPAAAPPPAGPAADLGFGHVHGVDLNLVDGVIYAATHTGVFRLNPTVRSGSPFATRTRWASSWRARTCSSAAVTWTFANRTPHLGLIRSTDRAETWTTVALAGEADFRSLAVSGSTVYGLGSTDGLVMRSDDDG